MKQFTMVESYRNFEFNCQNVESFHLFSIFPASYSNENISFILLSHVRNRLTRKITWWVVDVRTCAYQAFAAEFQSLLSLTETHYFLLFYRILARIKLSPFHWPASQLIMYIVASSGVIFRNICVQCPSDLRQLRRLFVQKCPKQPFVKRCPKVCNI